MYILHFYRDLIERSLIIADRLLLRIIFFDLIIKRRVPLIRSSSVDSCFLVIILLECG